MIRNDKNTGVRLVTANCGDEYSTCPAALVRVDKEMLEKWKHWDEVCKGLREQYTEFCTAEFVGVDVTFLQVLEDVKTENEEDDTENWADVLDREGDIWVETADDDSDDDYVEVEEKIWCTSVCMSGDGYVSFKGNGKHSGTEYWTENIKLEDLTK